MIAFKGRSSIKQYMPKKPTKHGFKVWIRADSKSGYVFQLECYTGRQGSTTEVGLGGNVVTRLTRDIVGQQYCVYMDNFFSSIPLFQRLLAFKQLGPCIPTGRCSLVTLHLWPSKDWHHRETWSSGKVATWL